MESVPNLYNEREQLLFKDWPCTPVMPSQGITLGIPRVLFFWDSMPFWKTLLQALGFTVKLSHKSTRAIYENGLSAVTSDTVCFPAKLVHGHLRDLHKQGVDPKDLQGKAVALIFAKNSTRTRTSLEVGIYQMGGLGTYLSANDLQTARGEPVQDTARALGRYYDAIVCRTYKQTTLDAMAQYLSLIHI